MNPRRRYRLFQDHKPPLIAFVVVAVTCLVMTAHMARSQATAGWLRAGAESAPRAGQQVRSGEVLERAVAPHAPPAVTPAPPASSYDPTTSASPDQHPLPDAGAAGEHQPQPSQQAEVAPVGEGPATPGTDADPGGTPLLIEPPAGTADDGGTAAGGHHGGHLFPVHPGSAEPASDMPGARDSREWRPEWIDDRDPKGHHVREHRHR